MPSDTAQIYQACIKPPGRAKTQSSTNTPTMHPSPPLDRVSLSPTSTFSTMGQLAAAPSSINTPSLATADHTLKRGRKSNPLSRSTRETQRKLNHSIIEKARRTKINKALAELRCLVPDTWGREGAGVNVRFVMDKDEDDEDTEDEDEDDDDDREYNPRSRGKRHSRTGSNSAHIANAKPGGVRVRKEKGFKLEVLERSVGYLREVIGRVRELEEEIQALRENAKTTVTRTEMGTGEYNDGCSRCNGKDALDTRGVHEAKKRKRDTLSEEEGGEEERPSQRFETDSLSPPLSAHTPSNIEFPAAPSRLPSISSWLPSSLPTSTSAATRASLHNNSIRFTHHSRSRSRSTSPRTYSYLPSPTSSTQLNPNNYHPLDGVPRKWNLGGPTVSSASSLQSPTKEPDPTIVSTSSMSKGGMTPEDEFAASSLLGLQNSVERRR